MSILKWAGRSEKAEVYTRFAAALAAKREPEVAVARPALEKLRQDLAREIRRRSLWQASPSYLGIHGYRSWSDDGSGRGSGALDELLLDACTELFVGRLPTLRGYLEAGSTIDALIPHMLRNFVHDAQKRSDRLGLRLFRLLRAAVRQAVEEGGLEIAEGDVRVTSGTLLRAGEGFVSEAERGVRLAELVSRWNDELLCDLVAAPSKRVPAVVARLTVGLGEIGAAGLPLFRFGELLAAVRLDARRRWLALFEVEQGEPAWEDEGEEEGWAGLCRAVEPEVEERIVGEDSFRHLIDCVARHIDDLATPEPVRGHLFRLWGFLCAFATDEAPAVPGERAGRLPSRRKLARFLGLPRDRYAELVRTLGGFLTHCRHHNTVEEGARP